LGHAGPGSAPPDCPHPLTDARPRCSHIASAASLAAPATDRQAHGVSAVSHGHAAPTFAHTDPGCFADTCADHSHSFASRDGAATGDLDPDRHAYPIPHTDTADNHDDLVPLADAGTSHLDAFANRDTYAGSNFDPHGDATPIPHEHSADTDTHATQYTYQSLGVVASMVCYPAADRAGRCSVGAEPEATVKGVARKEWRMWKLLWQALLMGVLVLWILTIGPVEDMTTASPTAIEALAKGIPASGPTIPEGDITTNLADYPNGQIPQYEKLEISFDITNTTATNPYFPYDENTPPGVESATGITVNALLLPPGETNWSNARILPCFYYQPVEEVGSGDNAALLPVGNAEWRCRFTPETEGTWKYKIQATDAGGSSESAVYQFVCADSDRRGFIRVSSTDYRFFEFSDGTPFVTPLVNVEQGNPFNSLAEIRANIQNMGENGIRFVRWFPTGEGANSFVAPYADTIRINWNFGDGGLKTDDVDTLAGKKFSYRPYYYSTQGIPVVSGSSYRLGLSAKVIGEKVVRAKIGNINGGTIDICSSTSTYHESHGDICNYKQDGWHDYLIEVSNTSDTTLSIALRGLYVSSDAPPPYNNEQEGKIRIHSIQFQRDETGNGDWSPNLLTRSDPDTYNYVDQRAAAKLDEILRVSEQYGVYHKLTLFHKNDHVLNRFLADGSVGDPAEYSRNFYSAEGQASRWYQRAYTRYFIARWSCSPALHSLELANENHLFQESYEAGFAVAEYVHKISPRHILMSNSFWGYWVSSFWTDPEKGQLIDYSDKHWYASEEDTNPEVVSNIWYDSAVYVRECHNRFQEYEEDYDYHKPIVRGEGGVWGFNEGQHQDILTDPQGTYYHKKLWSHVGMLGYTCDGEWYPRLFVPYNDNQFPNDSFDLFKMFAAYENFMRGEPVNNGNYWEIGTDLTGGEQITLTNLVGNLRVWGVRDANRMLLWIDNADHTWKNVVDGVPIPSVSATLTIPGFRAGDKYFVQWWDAYQPDPTEQIVGLESFVAQPDGSIEIAVDNLTKDLAVKILAVSELYLPLIQHNLITGQS